jgi:hypothetical protein
MTERDSPEWNYLKRLWELASARTIIIQSERPLGDFYSLALSASLIAFSNRRFS